MASSAPTLTWALFLLFLQGAKGLTKPQYCFFGCNSALYQISFNGSLDYCTNELFLKSNYYCAAIYCSPKEIRAGLTYANESCLVGDISLPPFDQIVPPELDLASIQRVSFADAPSTTPTAPVIPDAEFYAIGHRTTAAFYHNIAISYDFSWSFYGFWGLVLLVGMANRAIELLRHRKSEAKDSERCHRAPSLSTLSRIWLWIRRCLILPATFGQHCQEPIRWCTLPPRLESLLILIYIILNFVACFPGYTLLLPNTYYPTTRLQLVRFISDRTGTLAIANVPILWLFAARNDPFLWLTGWSFATYNRFHRWVARVATVQAIVHSIGYTLFDFYYGGAANYYADWAQQYWWTGQIATIVMSLMLVASVYSLRNSSYDLFLILHIIGAVIFIVTLWYHVAIFSGEYNGFIWPCVAVWSLDRLLRLARIVHSSLLPRIFKGSKALVTYDRLSEMLRIDVSDFIHSNDIRPGIFYYLYVPTALQGYKSHPFTLCSWERKLPASESSAPSITGSKDLEVSIEKDQHTTVQQTTTHEAPDREISRKLCHSLLIRPYEGFTGRLRQMVTSQSEGESSCQMTVFLEGPYGNVTDLTRFSNVLILAGGSGITAAISHSHRVLKTGSTSVHIIWAVPQRHLVDNICQNELGALLGHEQLDITVYLTGAAVMEPGALTLETPYKVHFGRPDILAVMRETRQESLRDLAVVSCGTVQMADICRRAVVDVLGESGPPVEYFNDTMSW